jgi:hypothetical protein
MGVDTGDISKTREARREFWRKLIARQQQSGLSVRDFSQQHRIGEQSVYQWRKRFAQQLPVKFALVETSCGASRFRINSCPKAKPARQ